MGLQATSRRTPIGIDASSRFINAVQLSRPARGWRIDAVASIPRAHGAGPLSGDDTDRLSSVLDRQGFRGRDIVLAVPSRHLLSTVLEVPAAAPAASIPQIARLRLATAHRCEPQSLEVACWELPPPARAIENKLAFAVGCRSRDANDVIDIFEAAGLNVVALDVASWAAVRACGPLLATPEAVALLNIGWTAAHLVVVRGGAVVHERYLAEHALHHLHAFLAEGFEFEPEVTDYILGEIGLESQEPQSGTSSDLLETARQQVSSHLDKLASELKLSLSYAAQEFGNTVSDPLLVHGEGASIPGAVDYLSSVLGVKLRTVAPTDVGDCKPSLETLGGSPFLITAFGLAQHPGD